MKRYFLMTAAFLMLASFSAFGQSYEELEAEYNRFKNMTSPNGDNSGSIVIVASAVRNEDGTVKVSILSNAKGMVPEFLIQPINSDKMTLTDSKEHYAGKSNKVVFRNGQDSANQINPIVIIAATPEADAVEIKFSVLNEDEPETSSTIIMISDEPEITAIRMFKRP